MTAVIAQPIAIKSEHDAAAAVAAVLEAGRSQQQQQQQATISKTTDVKPQLTTTSSGHAAVPPSATAISAMQQHQQQFQMQFQQHFVPQGDPNGRRQPQMQMQMQPQFVPYMQMITNQQQNGQPIQMVNGAAHGQPMMMIAPPQMQQGGDGMPHQMMAWPQMQPGQMMAAPPGMVMMRQGQGPGGFQSQQMPGGYPHFQYHVPTAIQPRQRRVQGDTSGGSSPRPVDGAMPTTSGRGGGTVDSDILDEDRPSYAELAYMAIEAALRGKASVHTMYRWVEANYPEIPRTSDPPNLWKSRMRHALSSKPYFVHTTDEHNDHAWTITKGSRPNFNVPRRPREQNGSSSSSSSSGGGSGGGSGSRYNGGADTVVVQPHPPMHRQYEGMAALLLAAGAGSPGAMQTGNRKSSTAGKRSSSSSSSKPAGAPRASKKKKVYKGPKVRKQSESAAAKAAAKKRNPKRPLTAYTCFVSEVRPQLMAAHPTKSFKIVAAMIGKMWKELPEDGRAPYRQRAEMDMERFRREKAELDAEDQRMGIQIAS